MILYWFFTSEQNSLNDCIKIIYFSFEAVDIIFHSVEIIVFIPKSCEGPKSSLHKFVVIHFLHKCYNTFT